MSEEHISKRSTSYQEKAGNFIRSKQKYGIISQNIMRHPYVSATAKSLYAYLASFAGSENAAFPGRDLICYEMNFNKDTFSKYMWELQCWQIIEIEQFRGARGQFDHNLYILDHYPPYIMMDKEEFEKNIKSSLQERINSKNKKANNKKPNIQASSPCPKLPDTVAPDTNNNNLNSNSFKNNRKQQQQENNTNLDSNVHAEKENVVVFKESKLNFDPKNSRQEIIAVFKQYDLQIHTATKAVNYLETLDIAKVELVAKTLAKKKQRIKNPIGLLESNPQSISESILVGTFYPEVKKTWEVEEYQLYIPP